VFSALPPFGALPVLVYPAFGGRFDQQTAALHSLLQRSAALPQLLMLAEGNAARVLLPSAQAWTEEHEDAAAVAGITPTLPAAVSAGESVVAAAAVAGSSSPSLPLPLPLPLPLSHTLSVHPCLERGHHCGLFPLCGPARQVSTGGLRWNLANEPMRWGSLISTNNVADADAISVRTSAPLVWTTQLQHAHTLDAQRDERELQASS
jgi:hypothetical protein